MSRMILFAPLPVLAASSAAGQFAAGPGTGAENLLTPDPKEVWADSGAGGVHHLRFDLGASTQLDSLFIGFVRGGGGGLTLSTWSGGPAGYTQTTWAQGLNMAPSARPAPRRRHLLHRLAAPVSARYVEIAVGARAAEPMTIGVVALGLAFQPTHNREWGGGRGVVDTGARERLPSGGFGTGPGAVKPTFGWTFGDLEDAEVEALHDLALDRGERRPLVVVEDPDATAGLNERIHWGLFDRFDRYERRSAGRTRWALAIEAWL